MKIDSIKWHKSCLKNQINTLEKLYIKQNDLSEKIADSTKEIMFYSMQIESAERLKKEKFDRDKFLKKRK